MTGTKIFFADVIAETDRINYFWGTDEIWLILYLGWDGQTDN